MFLKIISFGIPAYAAMKTGFHSDVSSLETGFPDTGVGRNAKLK